MSFVLLALLLVLATIQAVVGNDLEGGSTALPPIIPLAGRDRLLKEAHASIRRESQHAEWHSKGGERLLKMLLVRLEQLGRLPADDDGEAMTKRGGDLDLEALWLLCRSSMGGIEAALLELGQAQSRVERLRMHWHNINSDSPSLAFNVSAARTAGKLLANTAQDCFAHLHDFGRHLDSRQYAVYGQFKSLQRALKLGSMEEKAPELRRNYNCMVAYSFRP